MENLDRMRAYDVLKNGGYKCVLVKEESVYTSMERGVKPLLDQLGKNDLKGYSAADKVVGKAAAYLYVLMGVVSVYAAVISEPALAVFQRYGIDVSFDEKVEMIRNRTDTGYCPMEQATLGIDSPEEALIAIKDTLLKLHS